MTSDITQIREALLAQGWQIERRKGGHYVAYPPDRTKKSVIMPGTPGGGRWKDNLIAELRRAGFVWKGR